MDANRHSIFSANNGNKSTRSLFSSKSGKRKIKLIKNIKVIGAVREKVVKPKTETSMDVGSNTPEETYQLQNLKNLVSKNQ